MAPKLASVAAVASTLASTLAIANPPARVVPNFAAGGAMAPPVAGPTFAKPLSTPDGVPEVGQQRAMELMRTGALFRYTPGVVSETALAEAAMVEYTGFKYVVGFNSCGSALFIALKALGVQPSEKVLCNAFSFTAVPSAIHHAMATPVYVESTDGFVMDMDDLEKKTRPTSST
jgi:dTDP-4-amino-4,6-dideoxygalactose transaminase